MTILVTFHCSLLIWSIARIVFLCLLLVETIDLNRHKFIMNFHFNLATLVNSALFNYLATHTHTHTHIYILQMIIIYTTKLTVCIFERHIKCMESVKKILACRSVVVVVVMSSMSSCLLEREFLFIYLFKKKMERD